MDEIKCLDHGYVKHIDHVGDDTFPVRAARMSTGRGFVSWEPYERCKGCNGLRNTQLGGAFVNESFYVGGYANACAHPGVEKFPRGDLGLLEYLYKNKHMTPFEMSYLIIEVQAPILVFRQWQRHRTQSYNEHSARYGPLPDLYYVPEESRIQKQDRHLGGNKQGSGERLADAAAALIVRDISEQQSDMQDFYAGR